MPLAVDNVKSAEEQSISAGTGESEDLVVEEDTNAVDHTDAEPVSLPAGSTTPISRAAKRRRGRVSKVE